jgi:hypothetical protein
MPRAPEWIVSWRLALAIAVFVSGVCFATSVSAQRARNPFLPDLSDPATRACVAALDSARFETQVASLMTMERRSRQSRQPTPRPSLMVEDLARTRCGGSSAPTKGRSHSSADELPWTALWGSLLVVLEPSGRAQPISTAGARGGGLARRAGLGSATAVPCSSSRTPAPSGRTTRCPFVRDTVLVTFEFPGAIDQKQFDRVHRDRAAERAGVQPARAPPAPARRGRRQHQGHAALPQRARVAPVRSPMSSSASTLDANAAARSPHSLAEVAPIQPGRGRGPFDITVVAGAIGIDQASRRDSIPIRRPRPSARRSSTSLKQAVPKLAFSRRLHRRVCTAAPGHRALLVPDALAARTAPPAHPGTPPRRASGPAAPSPVPGPAPARSPPTPRRGSNSRAAAAR